MAASIGLNSSLPNLALLRFRGKILLAFSGVLSISAISLAIAYIGFERVTTIVESYRRSVSEADLAGNIDRDLIGYRSLVRYYVATGREEDAKAAQMGRVPISGVTD